MQPERPAEMKRVEAAGGKIINCDGYRVLGVLATSRSIGTAVVDSATSFPCRRTDG